MGVIIKLIMRGLKIIENSNQRKLKREKKRYNYHFTGQVQSVGFRYTARNAALLSGVTGWVYNSSDGAVIMEVQGTIEQIEKHLNKKLDVIKVKTFSESQSISRELMLVKVKYNKNNRRDIMEICDIMKADIIDMSKTNLMIQICDEPEKVKLFINMLSSISIVEIARTGTLALQKCLDVEN